eukprot:m.21373 g.21373  ORF g.21373 m.21373 type:complete len:169 (+) comp13362_c0_seq2:101-607(+)
MPRHYKASSHLNPTPTRTADRIFHEMASKRISLPPIRNTSSFGATTTGRYYTYKAVDSGVIPKGYSYDDAYDPSKTFPKTYAINDQMKTLLADGPSHQKEGRTWRYLQQRNKESPEDKYTLPMTETQLMSWGAFPPPKNSVISTRPFGRTETIRNTFYAKNLQGSLAH